METSTKSKGKHRRGKVIAALQNYFRDEPDVREVIIFGSFAAGDQSKHSDLDIIVVKNTRERFVKRLTSDYLDIDEVVGMPVDVFIYTPEEWKSKKESLFFRNAAKERIL
jgi:predicted nucleotidyltransferase